MEIQDPNIQLDPDFDNKVGKALLEGDNQTLRDMGLTIENDKPFLPLTEVTPVVQEDPTVAAVSDAWVHDEAGDAEMKSVLGKE